MTERITGGKIPSWLLYLVECGFSFSIRFEELQVTITIGTEKPDLDLEFWASGRT